MARSQVNPSSPPPGEQESVRTVIYSNDIMSALKRENLILEPDPIKASISRAIARAEFRQNYEGD